MKLFIMGLVFVSSLLTISSCSDEKNSAQQYGNTMMQSYKSAQKLDAKVNVAQVQKSIQEFYASSGRYPENLNELSSFSGLTLKSNNYDYNPVDGTLVEKK